MQPFIITYSEGGETSHVQWSGYDAAHAEERFMDTMEQEGGTQGLRIIAVTRAVNFSRRKMAQLES